MCFDVFTFFFVFHHVKAPFGGYVTSCIPQTISINFKFLGCLGFAFHVMSDPLYHGSHHHFKEIWWIVFFPTIEGSKSNSEQYWTKLYFSFHHRGDASFSSKQLPKKAQQIKLDTMCYLAAMDACDSSEKKVHHLQKELVPSLGSSWSPIFQNDLS